jgi:hypothetical protein
MHNVYDNVFKSKPVMDVKMIVGNKNLQDIKKEIIRKRPKRSLLTNKPAKSKN